MYQIATGAFETAGLEHPLTDRKNSGDAGCAPFDHSGAPLTGLAEQTRQLLDEIQRLKAEQKVLRERESKIMELLGTKSPDQILHDFRNVLNEKELFRVLAFRDEK